MENCNIQNLKNQLDAHKDRIVLFGAGHIGELALYSFKQLGIPVNYFCDNNKQKTGFKFLGIETITLKKLKEFGNEVNIFIANNNALSVNSQLKKEGFKNVYSCINLFKSTDFSKLTNIKYTQI